MALSTELINIDITLPDGAEFASATFVAELSGSSWDTVDNQAVPKISVTASLDASGVGTISLWPPDRGTKEVYYTAKVRGTLTSGNIEREYVIGRFEPTDGNGPFDLNVLLEAGYQETIITPTLVERAEKAADEAEAARDIAIANAAGTTTYASQGDLPAVTVSDNGTWAQVLHPAGLQAWLVVAGAWVFQTWLKGPRYDDADAFFAASDTFADDTIVRTRTEGFVYKAIPAAATGSVPNAGGQDFEVLSGDAPLCPQQFGAPANGVDTDNAATQKMFDYLNALDDFDDEPAWVNFYGFYLFDTTSPVTSQRSNMIVDAHGAQFRWTGDGTIFNLGAQVDQDNLSAETFNNFNNNVHWFGGFFSAGSGGLPSNATAVGLEFGNVRDGSVSHVRARNVRQMIRFCGTGTFTISSCQFRNFNYAIYCYAAGDALLLMQDVNIKHCSFTNAADGALTFAPYAIYSEGWIASWTVKENTCAMNAGGLFKFPTGSDRGGETKESQDIYCVRNYCEQSTDANPYIHVYADYGGIKDLTVDGGVYPGNSAGGANIQVERIGSAGGVGSNNNMMLRVINASFPVRDATAIKVDLALDRARAEFSGNMFRQKGSDGGQVFDLHIDLEATIGNNSWLEDDLPLGISANTNPNVTLETKKHRQRFASASAISIPVDCGWVDITGVADVDTINASTNEGETWSGHMIMVTFSNAATLKDGTGNLNLNGSDIVGSTNKSVALFYDGPNDEWKLLS